MDDDDGQSVKVSGNNQLFRLPAPLHYHHQCRRRCTTSLTHNRTYQRTVQVQAKQASQRDLLTWSEQADVRCRHSMSIKAWTELVHFHHQGEMKEVMMRSRRSNSRQSETCVSENKAHKRRHDDDAATFHSHNNKVIRKRGEFEAQKSVHFSFHPD